MAKGLRFGIELGVTVPGAAAVDKLQKKMQSAAVAADKLKSKQEVAEAKRVAKEQSLAVKGAEKRAKLEAAALAKRENNPVGDVAKEARQERHKNAALLPSLADLPKLKLATGELDALKQKLRDDKLAVTNLSASLRQLQQASTADVGTLKLLEAELQQKKNSLAAVQQKLVLSGNAAKFGSEGTNRLTTTLKELAEAAGGQRIGGFASKLISTHEATESLKESVGSLSTKLSGALGVSEGAATGIVAVGAAAVGATAAVVALGVGIGALVYHFAGVALEASEAKTRTMDMLETMLGSEEAAKGLASQFREIVGVTAVSGGRIAELAKEFSAAEVPVDKLKDSILAVAQAESVLPEAGGKLQKLIEKTAQTGKFEVKPKQLTGTGVTLKKLYAEIAAETGKGVDQVAGMLKAGTVKADVGITALNKVISDKFGGIAAKRANMLSIQLQRFHENVSKLFKDVNVEPFANAVSQLLKVFDQSTIAGTAMHTVLTDVFSGLFDIAGKVVPYVRVLLKGLIIAGLTVAVAMKPLLYQIGLIGPTASDQQPGIKLLEDSMNVLAGAVGAVGTAINYVGTHKVVFDLLAVSVGLVLLPLLALPAILAAGAAAFVYIAAKIGEFGRALSFVYDQALGAGKNLVSGLAQGILNAAGTLISAVVDVGKGAISAFKRVWDMHSPSRVGIGLGENFGGSVNIGLARTKPANDNAIARLYAVPRDAGRSPEAESGSGEPVPSARASGRGKGGVVVNLNIQEGAVVIQSASPQGVDDLREHFVDIMADVLEQAMNKAGLAPTGS